MGWIHACSDFVYVSYGERERECVCVRVCALNLCCQNILLTFE